MALLVERVVHDHALDGEVEDVAVVPWLLVEGVGQDDEIAAADLDVLVDFLPVYHVVIKDFLNTLVQIFDEVLIVGICLLVQYKENMRWCIFIDFDVRQCPAANLENLNCLSVNLSLQSDY